MHYASSWGRDGPFIPKPIGKYTLRKVFPLYSSLVSEGILHFSILDHKRKVQLFLKVRDVGLDISASHGHRKLGLFLYHGLEEGKICISRTRPVSNDLLIWNPLALMVSSFTFYSQTSIFCRLADFKKTCLKNRC